MLHTNDRLLGNHKILLKDSENTYDLIETEKNGK